MKKIILSIIVCLMNSSYGTLNYRFQEEKEIITSLLEEKRPWLYNTVLLEPQKYDLTISDQLLQLFVNSLIQFAPSECALGRFKLDPELAERIKGLVTDEAIVRRLMQLEEREFESTLAEINKVDSTRAQMFRNLVDEQSIQENLCCVICTQRLIPGQIIVGKGIGIDRLTCIHRFHEVCLNEWLQRKHNCPVCRAATN